MFKYLFGKMRLVDDQGESMKDDVLMVTRRCDSFQHRDMAQSGKLIPFAGGFCGSALKPDNYFPGQFNGESISCRVKTDSFTAEEVKSELEEHDIYMSGLSPWETHSKKAKLYLTAIFVPKGTRPDKPRNPEIKGPDWVLKTPEEFCSEMKEVFDDPYYF
ncbi:hypothetical protein D9_0015 [Aeromonas phage D9]|nr:hypothetical protein D9_0015 [Aeromonas phage D9]